MRLRPEQDAVGRALLDFLEGKPAQEVIERSDGFVAPSPGPAAYFAPPRAWPAYERAPLRRARGRVLDLGCGAGRHALYLQERGHAVVAIDSSPLAGRVARRRGVTSARVLPVTRVSSALGRFDTILMLGNNVGLLASRSRARWLLPRLRGVTRPGARLLATSLDVYRTDDPSHRRYQAANRRRGRMSGQIRMRVRYRDLATPWFDYLMVSPKELEALCRGTGWRVERYHRSAGPQYGAVLAREDA